jgi:hypothetical protein
MTFGSKAAVRPGGAEGRSICTQDGGRRTTTHPDASGRWNYPFFASLCLLLVGAVSALFLRPDVAFEGPQKA